MLCVLESEAYLANSSAIFFIATSLFADVVSELFEVLDALLPFDFS